jgi:hypothetical protein
MTPRSLPPLARVLSGLIPAEDRQAIVGDLLEEAEWRGLSGGRLTLSLCASCGAIAAGLAIDGARAALTPPPAGELAAGLAVDGGHLLRGLSARAFVGRALVFGAGVTLLAWGAEMLIATLMVAAGLR